MHLLKVFTNCDNIYYDPLTVLFCATNLSNFHKVAIKINKNELIPYTLTSGLKIKTMFKNGSRRHEAKTIGF